MLRIVSLIASATEIVHALGLGDFQVGRSHECDYPEAVRSLRVCTRPAFAVDGSSAEIDWLVKQKLASALSVYEVFTDVLEMLQPTHIITQTQCKVCAVSLEDVERALGMSVPTRPKLVALEPNCLADIWEDIRRVASACGAYEAGADLITSLQTRMEAISAQAYSDPIRPRAACIEWHEPLMPAANWVPELIDMANAEYVTFNSFEELRAADPDVIITSPCGFDLPRIEAEMYWLTNRPGWSDLRAVRSGRVRAVDGNQYINRPGPRIVESLEILAQILHSGQPLFGKLVSKSSELKELS